MSVRALANLLCLNCGEVTLHAGNVCTDRACQTLNQASGNPPYKSAGAYFTGRSEADTRATQKRIGDQSKARTRKAREQVITRIRA